MKQGLKLSIVTAGLIALGTFAGCSSSDGGTPPPDSLGLVGADGFIVKLMSPAKVTCGANVYNTDTNVTTPQGVMVFNGIKTLTADCKIETPANAIMDQDGDGVYTVAGDGKDTDGNNTVGFIMRADGNDTVVSHLTTMVQDLIATGDTAKANKLRPLTRSYNPVTAINDAATTGTADQNATRAKAIQLLTLGEAIKTMKKAGATVANIATIDVDTMITNIESNSTTADVTTMLASVPITLKTAATDKAVAQQTLLTTLASIKASGQTVDLVKYAVSVSDGGQTATTAINAATTGTFDETKVADLNLTTLDSSINTANTSLTTAVSSAPALISLGDTLTIGSISAKIVDGKFDVEVPVATDSNLSNYSKIEMLGSTISKGFSAQTGVSLKIQITNKADANDMVTMQIGGITLSSNETNTTVTTAIADGAPISVTEAINGASTTAYTTVKGPLTNTDFSFDLKTVVGTNNDVTAYIEKFNKYFQNAGKVYDVSLSLMGTNATQVTSDYLQDNNTTHTITGKVTTTGTVKTDIGSTTPPTTPTLPTLTISLGNDITVNKGATSNVAIATTGNSVTTTLGTGHNTSIATASISGTTLIVTGVAKGETTISVIAEDNTTAQKTDEIKVTVPNTTPVPGTAPAVQNLTVGTAMTAVTVTATDADAADTLTFSATGLPAGITISTSGVISGTPTTAQTAADATVSITDGTGTVTQTVSFTVVEAAAIGKDITGWLETANGANGVTIFGTSTTTGTVYVEKAFTTNIGTLAAKCISFTKGTEAGSLITAANGQTSEICVYPNKAYAAEAISIAVKWDDNSVSFVDLKAGDLD